MKKHSAKALVLRLAILAVCVAVLWFAVTQVAGAYGNTVSVIEASEANNQLEITYVDNTSALPIEGFEQIKEMGLNKFSTVYPDVGNGTAAFGGMFINLNAQSGLAMMSGNESMENTITGMLGAPVSACYATALEIQLAQPSLVVQFTNRSSKPAELEFDYQITAYNETDVRIRDAAESNVQHGTVLLDDLLSQFNIDGLTAQLLMNDANYSLETRTMTGSVKVLIQSGETYHLPVEFPANDFCGAMIQFTNVHQTECTVKSISFLPAEYDYYVGGTLVSKDGGEVAVDIDCEAGTPVIYNIEGKKLGYWFDGNGNIYKSDDAVGSTSIKYGRDKMMPVFVDQALVRTLEANGVTFYGWSDAFDAAGQYGVVTLIAPDETNIASLTANVHCNDYNTLNRFTVPANVQFIVPHTPDEIAEGYFYYSTHKTDIVYGGSNDTATAYSKLWVPENYELYIAAGAEVIVNGVERPSGSTQGEVSDGFGMIELDGTINVDGNLVVRGYIAQRDYEARTSSDKSSHKGHISVSETGNVDIVFQMMDFRGGTQTFQHYAECMPITMYSFDSIMVETEYASGATLSASCSVTVMNVVTARANVLILSDQANSMFQMHDASVVTDYQYDGDRFIFNIEDGSVNLNAISIQLYEGAYLTTSAFQLPLHDGMVVNLNNGADVTLNYAVKLLPGAEINVDSSSTIHLNNALYIFGKEDYDPTFSLSNKNFRKRTNTVLVENGGQAVTPDKDPEVNLSGHLIIGDYVLDEYTDSFGVIYQSRNTVAGINAGEGAVFTIPEGFSIAWDQDVAYTTEMVGTSSSLVTDYDDNNRQYWVPVKGLIGGMSNRIVDDPETTVNERYVSFTNKDLANKTAGYEFYAAEQDGEIYWYRYSVVYKDTEGNVIYKHYVAPAYDELMIHELNYNGSNHVINSIAVTDVQGNPLPVNVGKTSLTYTGYVGQSYAQAASSAKVKTFDLYNQWQGVRVDSLNLAENDNGPVTDVVVTLGTQESGWLVKWNQSAASDPGNTATWYSFTAPDGTTDYGKPGAFGILDYSVKLNGTAVDSAVLGARIETDASDNDTTYLMISGVPFAADTDSAEVTMTTAANIISTTLHYKDNSTKLQKAAVVEGTNYIVVAIPQPETGWDATDIENDNRVVAEGFTVTDERDLVTLSWTGDKPANSQVDIYLEHYDYKIVYEITNLSDSASLTFERVYTNEASYTQDSANVSVSEGTHRYYFVGDPDSTTLVTETVPGTDLYTVKADMKAYDYQVQFYAVDTLLKNEFLLAGGEMSYVFDNNITTNGAPEIRYLNGGNASMLTDDSHDAYLDQLGNLVPATIAVSNVNCDAILTVTPDYFDHIVSFFDQDANLLSMEYVSDGGSAYFNASAGTYITSVSDNAVVSNDNYEMLTNTVSDGWRRVKLDGVTSNKAITLGIAPYVTKVAWIQKLDDSVVDTTVHYFTSGVSSDSTVPADGYIFLGVEGVAASTGAANGIPQFTIDTVSLPINSQGDFDVTVNLGLYAHKVVFVNAVTGLVEKTVYVNEAGFDMTRTVETLPYFQYSGSEKIMLKDVELTSGAAQITSASAMKFDGVAVSAWRRVEVADITSDDVTVHFAPLPYKHSIKVTYTDPWGDTEETVYATADSYAESFTDRQISDVQANDALSVVFDASSFTLTLPSEAVTEMPVYVSYRRTGEDNLSMHITKVGAKNPAVVEVTDGVYGTFTVELSTPYLACYVLLDNGDDTYVKLKATPVSGNKYSFSLTREQMEAVAASEKSIKVALKGDANGDGRISAQDATFILQVRANMRSFDSSLCQFIADATGEGKLNAKDATLIKRALAYRGADDSSRIKWDL